MPVSIGSSYEHFIDVDIGSDVLPMFYLTVITCLNQIILRSPDFNQYWIETFKASNPGKGGNDGETKTDV